MTNLQKAIASVASQGITCIKNADNPYFNSKYADLKTVVEALKEPLKKAGVTYYFCPAEHAVVNDDQCDKYWTCDLVVISEDDSQVFSFPFSQSDPQKMGSALTYAKRYLLTTVFNVIAEEDDDGNAASGNVVKTVTKKKPTAMTDVPKPKFF